MLKIQEKVLELLIEIDELCRREGIEYSLAEKTAVGAIRRNGFIGNEYLAEIMVRAGDYGKLAKALADREDRELETLENNVCMDGVYARYVNSGTTAWDIDIGSHFKCRAVCVNIRILRAGKKEGKGDADIENMIRSNGRLSLKSEIKFGNNTDKKKAVLLWRTRNKLRKPSVLSEYFKKSLKDKGSSEEMFYYAGSDKRVFERRQLDSYKDIDFEGRQLRILENEEYLLSVLKNKDNESGEYDGRKIALVFDAEMPYKDYLARVEQKGLFGAREIELQGDFFAYNNLDYGRKYKNMRRDWFYVRRTIDRINIWEEYRAREDEIKSLYAAGDYDKLRELLADYIDRIELFYRRRMGFCYDHEIFDIACAVMEHDGKSEMVGKVRKWMPKEYEETLPEFLAREGYEIQGE